MAPSTYYAARNPQPCAREQRDTAMIPVTVQNLGGQLPGLRRPQAVKPLFGQVTASAAIRPPG